MTSSVLQGGNLPADLSNLPGMLPPPGVIPNFDNPYSRGGTYTAVATIITVAMVIFVTSKLYTKYFITRKLGWDDRKSSGSASQCKLWTLISVKK